MPETTPLIKAALNLRAGAGFDVYPITRSRHSFLCGKRRCLDIFENHGYNNNRTENIKHENVNGGQYGNII